MNVRETIYILSNKKYLYFPFLYSVTSLTFYHKRISICSVSSFVKNYHFVLEQDDAYFE